MSNQNAHVEKVTDVIQVMKAGVDFYKEAIEKVENDSLKSTFRNMIVSKEDAIEKLQPLAVSEQGERETGSSWLVDARKMYTKFAGAITSDTDHTYVSQLEEVEDKVLEALDDAMEEEQPTVAMTTLRTVRASAQSLHDEMKALKMSTDS